MRSLLAGAGLQQGEPMMIDGPLTIRLWPATRAAGTPVAQPHELAA
jgi:hypothetical protein